MRSAPIAGRRFAGRAAGSLSLAVAVLVAASCAQSSSSAGSTPAPMSAVGPVTLPPMPTKPSTTDPRVGLRAGLTDAGEAASNMVLVGHHAKPAALEGEGGARGLTFANSDLAFKGNYVYQGNFSGFQIWDISNPASPTLRNATVCATGQGDPSIYGNLLFISSESTGDRTDCGTQGIHEQVSMDRAVGVRIYDVSDMSHPKKIIDVQTCRGSHTHTLVPDPTDKNVVYVYVSGSAGVRSPNELPGCYDLPRDSVGSARFRIEIIRVPLDHPEQAKVVSFGHIFNDLAAPTSHGDAPTDLAVLEAAKRAGAFTIKFGDAEMVLPTQFVKPMLDSVTKARGGSGTATRADSLALKDALPGIAARMFGAGGAPTGPNQCHDITVYPAIGLAGGACGGYGLLLDIRDPLNPKRLQAAGDSNFAFWHSATFNNDGTKVLFTDEWGGGTSPKCRADDPIDWGGDAIFTIANGRMTQGAYFKMPAAQTSTENCVAHNGSLVPVPGRDIMAQGWYQGGLDVIDFTDAKHPYEIAYFDRGPVDATTLVTAGFWCAYWYNGHIIASEIARGIDIFDLKPSPYLSQNEIDAAKLVRFDTFNPQMQPKFVWPAAFPVVRSYLDQLVRGGGLSPSRTSAISAALASAERMNGAARKSALEKLASEMDGDAGRAADAARVKAMAAATRDLASATR
jgi:hypothetical protein